MCSALAAKTEANIKTRRSTILFIKRRGCIKESKAIIMDYSLKTSKYIKELVKAEKNS
jgi:hypothetical protein